MLVTVLKLDRSASGLTTGPVHVASMASLSITAVGAMETAMPGFIEAEIQPPMAGVFSGGRLTKLRGPGKGVSSPQQHQGATHNHFSPLLGLGSKMNLCFGELENSTVVSGRRENNGAIRREIWIGLN